MARLSCQQTSGSQTACDEQLATTLLSSAMPVHRRLPGPRPPTEPQVPDHGGGHATMLIAPVEGELREHVEHQIHRCSVSLAPELIGDAEDRPQRRRPRPPRLLESVACSNAPNDLEVGSTLDASLHECD